MHTRNIKKKVLLLSLFLITVINFQNCGDGYQSNSSIMSSQNDQLTLNQQNFPPISCAIDNGSGEQTYDTDKGVYNDCSVIMCNKDYRIENNSCVFSPMACPIINGNGMAQSDGSCLVSDCNSGFHVNSMNNSCEADTIACSVANGVGQQVWNGADYGACTPTSCAQGYDLQGSSCVVQNPGPSTDQFPCLTGKNSNQIKQGPNVLTSSLNSKSSQSPVINANDVLDLRNTYIPYLGSFGARHYPVTIENDRGVCVVGGEFIQKVPLDDSWSGHYAHGNSSSILYYYGAQNGLIQGAYTFNAHDSFRTARSDSSNLPNKNSLIISGIWADYNRDDVVENESSLGGDITIKDSLMSTFVGFSTRLKNQPVNARINDTFTVDSVILRLEPMPEPHKASSRRNIVKNGVRYGHGHLFKLGSGGIKWVIKNNIFMFEMIPSDDFVDFPPANRIKECDGNTVIWAGPANQFDEFVAKHDATGCTNHTVTMDFSVWQNAVDDWHARYPDVGRSYKPAPGTPYDMSFPRVQPSNFLSN